MNSQLGTLIKKNKILRYAGSSIFITAILIGIFGNINLVVFDKWSLGNNSPYQPYNYELFAEWLGHYCSLDNRNCENECNKLNEEHIPYCYRSIGRDTASKLKFEYNKSTMVFLTMVLKAELVNSYYLTVCFQIENYQLPYFLIQNAYFLILEFRA